MSGERVRIVDALLEAWSGDMVAKLADPEFLARARDPDTFIVGSEWEFVAEEGSQSLGMTSGHKGVEGMLSIWARWIEAFERWDARLDGCPVEIERERVIARVKVEARSHAGLELDLTTGLIYSFSGVDLQRVHAYGTWEETLAAAGVTAADVRDLERARQV